LFKFNFEIMKKIYAVLLIILVWLVFIVICVSVLVFIPNITSVITFIPSTLLTCGSWFLSEIIWDNYKYHRYINEFFNESFNE
jgi:hypothetical protein